MKQIKFIDLVCGIGGFHQALYKVSHNIKCVYACDIDIKCREMYNINYNFKPDIDIKVINEEDIPDFDILFNALIKVI
jgi:DNA (cytosine-5)-methyltransferase 1